MSFWHSPNAGDITFNLDPANPRKIVDRLSAFTDKVQKSAATGATRKGANVMKEAAIQNAQKFDDEDTKEQIFANVFVQSAPRLGRRIGGIAMRTGVLGGARQYALTRENVRKGRVRADGTQRKSYKTLGDAGNPGGDTWYWRFVEFGTAKTRARKFLRDAMERNLDGVRNTVFREMEKRIAKLEIKK